jgi:hypothetical protein
VERRRLHLRLTQFVTLRRKNRHGGQHHRESAASRRKATAAAEQTVDEGTERVSKAVEKIGDTARRARETASRSSEELLTIGRENMEGVARASQAMLKGASELGSLWASFWNEQLTTGMGDALAGRERQLG